MNKMLWQIGLENIELAVKRQIQKEYQLRICTKEGAVERAICWVTLGNFMPEGNTMPGINLYCGLDNLNEHFSYHTRGVFHRKQTGLNSLNELVEKAGKVLMWATWERQSLQEMGSSEPILAFVLPLAAENLSAFPIFKPNKKYSDIVTVDLSAFAARPNSVTVKLTAARKGNFFEPIPESPYFRRIFEFGVEKLWLIVDVTRN